MGEKFKLQIVENLRPVFEDEYDGPVELGRQARDEGGALSQRRDPEAGCMRLVLCPSDDQTIFHVSRRHLRLEPAGPGKLRVSNLSPRLPLPLGDGRRLRPNETVEVILPVDVNLAGRLIHLSAEDEPFDALPERTLPPAVGNWPGGASPEAEGLVYQLQATLRVFQSAASAQHLFKVAAETVVAMAGLDSARVMLFEDGWWKDVPESLCRASPTAPDRAPSKQVLNRVKFEKRTFWQAPGRGPALTESLMGVTTVVAAPILNGNDEVIGALYGARWLEGLAATIPPITRLEAMLVEVLASAVADGLLRIENERKALEQSVKFEQFFTPELARQLEANPDLLKGSSAEITVLFCDIRNFSTISEVIGPERLMEWISDVLQGLSECVREHKGVLVEYIGDGLMAMWGAPVQDDQHPRLACRAALAMLERLDPLKEKWAPDLKGNQFSLGIGVNTGVARVGNAGCKLKFKYGPLGNMVTVASRVRGLTKDFQTRLLVTKATMDKLDELSRKEIYYTPTQSRRLGAVQVVNVKEPVTIYELTPPGLADADELNQGYEEALRAFEEQKYRDCIRMIGNLLGRFFDDGPTMVLFERAIRYRNRPPTPANPFDPVFRFDDAVR